MSRLSALRQAAAQAPELLLQREEPHPAGLALGLASVGLGIWLSGRGGAVDPLWAWLALAGALLGMVLYLGWKHRGPGWRLHFASRSVSPVGQPGTVVVVQGGGWMLRTGPGARFAHVALDLMHEERGLVARLYEHPGFRRGHRKQLSALADTLAERLGAQRVGPRF